VRSLRAQHSRLTEFWKLEQQLAAQLAELETLKNYSGLKKEIEFETKLRGLLSQYGYSLREIVGILDSQAGKARKGAPVVADKTNRKARSVKSLQEPAYR
jgi:hypothetical protein